MPLPEKPSVEATVTQWIELLREGDDSSVEHLWERYFRRLTRLAEQRLPSPSRRAFDEEDVALSAFHSLCVGVQRGRFEDLQDRDGLWALLAVITARKAKDRMVAEHAQKRGAGVAPVEIEVAQVLGSEPTPEFAAQLAEESERLLECLHGGELRAIAIKKLEGYENAEIARSLGCALRTVERRLALIRQTWQEMSDE